MSDRYADHAQVLAVRHHIKLFADPRIDRDHARRDIRKQGLHHRAAPLKLEPDDLPTLGELCALQRRRSDMAGLAWALERRGIPGGLGGVPRGPDFSVASYRL